MCRIFAGQDPDGYAFQTRSVRLSGLSTSMRLEARFWRLIDEIAVSQGMSTPKFMSTLHDEVMELHGEVRNFASLLRCCCLIYLESQLDGAAAETSAPASVAAIARAL